MLKTIDVSFDQFDECMKKYHISKEDIVYIHFSEATWRFVIVFQEKYIDPDEMKRSLYSWMQDDNELPESLRYLNNQPVC